MTSKKGLFALVFGFFCIHSARAGEFTIEDRNGQLILAERGKPILAYVYKTPDATDAPTPSNYIHPLLGLQGESITAETSPADGAPGIHWAWSGLGIGNTLIDIESGSGGRREFERFLGTDTLGDEAVVALQNAWITESDGQAKAIENLTFTVSPVNENTRKIDFTVLIRNISDHKLYLQGQLPGSGLTLALDPQRTDWAFSNPSGWVRENAALYLSPWTIATYRDDRRSTRSGLAILQDSRNPGYSTPNWMLQEGPRLTVGPTEDFKTELKSSGFIEFRYRIILFKSAGGGLDIAAEYAEFMGH